jgi:hypothetical protein
MSGINPSSYPTASGLLYEDKHFVGVAVCSGTGTHFGQIAYRYDLNIMRLPKLEAAEVILAGGGAAGAAAAGGNGSDSAATAGTGNSGIPSNAGTGGAGQAGNAAGNAGVLYGGGGGGSRTTAATARAGGNGRAGYAIIDWIPPCGMGLMG